MTALLRAAVVGAGPSGFYATEQLLLAGFAVDLYDALPTPFGLVRAGVAPDHPKIKSVTRVYEKTARHPAFRFFGGVELGTDVARVELLDRYHAVVYAVGAPADNRLGIPGEDLPGSVAATEFVGWYNGHPAHAGHKFDLSSSRAVVIGNGNVAIDVARMLVLDPDELAPTDTADHAIRQFAEASVRNVVILGRRGPAQAAFTTPELRELGDLARADVGVDGDGVDLDVREGMAPGTARNLKILAEYARRRPSGKSHHIELRFLRSPVEILGEDEVEGLRVVRNRLDGDRALPTETEEVISCGLVVRSIGYRGRKIPGVPFDERRGLIRNVAGRVTTEDGEPLPGEFVVGWIKRGPSGVIGTNKKDAAETTAKILEDAEAGGLASRVSAAEPEAIVAWLGGRVTGMVTWEGWRAIDDHEVRTGGHARPRMKLIRVSEMLDVVRQVGAV
jgi:ferredoxin--NADP+ reductase